MLYHSFSLYTWFVPLKQTKPAFTFGFLLYLTERSSADNGDDTGKVDVG